MKATQKEKFEIQKDRATKLILAGRTTAYIAGELSVPPKYINDWRKEIKDLVDKENIEVLLATESSVVKKLAKDVTNQINDKSSSVVKVVNSVVGKIDNLTILNETLQDAGLKAARKIESMTVLCDSPTELNVLVDSLAKLQTAFFSRGSNVNVLNMNNETSDSGLSAFKSLQRKS